MIPRLALTLGDPGGIGPEVVLGALADPRTQRFFTPLLVGSASVLAQHAERLGRPDVRFEVVEDPGCPGAGGRFPGARHRAGD